MKRGIGKLTIILLLISVFLSSTLVCANAASSQTALPDPDALQTQSVKLSRASKELVVRMVFSNAGDTGITEFGLALAFYDKNDKRMFALPNTLDGYVDDVCYWYYTPDDVIKPGKEYNTEDSFAGYLNAGKLDVAIRYYRLASGEYVNIPESSWVWFSTDGGIVDNTPNRTFYADPDASIFDLSGKVQIGYHYYLLDDYNASFYSHSQGGEWLTEIEVGSMADSAGLMVGDLVVAVDGVKPTENTFAVEYAMAKIAQGESTTWEFERDGIIHTVDLALQN